MSVPFPPPCAQDTFENTIKGGTQITTDVESAALSVNPNCNANGIPQNINANNETPCSSAVPQSFLIFEICVPTGTPQCK